jgi:hypothetical protein
VKPPAPPAPPLLSLPTLQSTFDCSGPPGQDGRPSVKSFVKFYPDKVYVEVRETYKPGGQAPLASSARLGQYDLSENRLFKHQTGFLEDVGVWRAARSSDEYSEEVIENWTWSRFSTRIITRRVYGASEPAEVIFALCERNDAYGAKLDFVKGNVPASLFYPDNAAAGIGREKQRIKEQRERLIRAVNYLREGGAPVKPGISLPLCLSLANRWLQVIEATDGAVDRLNRMERAGNPAPYSVWAGQRSMYETSAKEATDKGCIPSR